MSDVLKKHVKRSNSDVAVIPGGVTTVVQPLDVCLNKPLLDHICEVLSH